MRDENQHTEAFVASCTEQQGKPRKQLEKGTESLVNGDYKKAIQELSLSIMQNPFNPDAYMARGEAYRITGELQKAKMDFTNSIRQMHPNPLAHFGRGLVCLSIFDPNQTISDFTIYIKYTSECPEGYYQRGMAYALRGEKDKALDDFHKAQSLGAVGLERHIGLLSSISWVNIAEEGPLTLTASSSLSTMPLKQCPHICGVPAIDQGFARLLQLTVDRTERYQSTI